MSRTSYSIRRSRQGGTFRPQVEALENRLAPGSLLDASLAQTFTPGDSDDPDLAFLVGLASSPQHGVAITPQLGVAITPQLGVAITPHLGVGTTQQHEEVASPQDRVVTTRPVVDFATQSIVFGESTVLRTEAGVSVHLTA